ncbi:MAG TPA: hypothetical protein VK335_06480 [Bryobacteraceae bacterium]|nr:hypothetical protein [Bryobacteraceae bacterium]
MDAANRSVIAYIAGRLITGADAWWMQDHDRGHRVHFEGFFEPGVIKVYSHELHSHVSGVGGDGKYTLFQHGVGGAVDLLVNLEEQTFSGWEHLSGFHFFGDVADRTIRLYDYQGMEWHLYTI